MARAFGSYPKGHRFEPRYRYLCGPLAQLVRAPGSKPVGPGFESLMVHHIFFLNTIAEV